MNWVYVFNDLTCSRANALESFEFPTTWLRLESHSLTKSLCNVYLPLYSSDYKKCFDYLTSKADSISPFTEIFILGDFIDHCGNIALEDIALLT